MQAREQTAQMHVIIGNVIKQPTDNLSGNPPHTPQVHSFYPAI